MSLTRSAASSSIVVVQLKNRSFAAAKHGPLRRNDMMQDQMARLSWSRLQDGDRGLPPAGDAEQKDKAGERGLRHAYWQSSLLVGYKRVQATRYSSSLQRSIPSLGSSQIVIA